MSDALPARRPPHRRNQTAPILLRLEPEQLDAISKAAKHVGLARAAWMRSTLLQAARGVLKEAS
jgi:uncharacterized protein (DUF1778 family)